MIQQSMITDLASLARYILSPECRSIVALTGAGISVSAGIPDFRSPGGMYDTLQPDLITATPQERDLMHDDPTNAVTKEMFFQNQFPYLEVRRPFILGTQEKQWKATIGHRFFELLETKTQNKLTRIYTQNIDGLDYQMTEIPENKIVSVHGCISKVRCEGCNHPMDFDRFCDAVRNQIKDMYCTDEQQSSPTESTQILCEKCKKPLVKPSTVLFGGDLPMEFLDCVNQDLPHCDLLIVAGTSLVVAPANAIVYNVSPSDCQRVVVNRDPVGQELGIEYYNDDGEKIADTASYIDSPNKKYRDYWAKGDCDEVFLELIHHLGWSDDLLMKVDELPPQSIELLQRKKVLN